MAGYQTDLTGGESIYCINSYQMEKATELFTAAGESSDRVRAILNRLENDLSRNEQAAVAMLLLQRLNGAALPTS